MAHPVHIVMSGQQVYGVMLKRDTVFLTAEQIQALDRFLQLPATDAAIYGAEVQAAQSTIRQALGFTEVIEVKGA